MIRKDWAAVVEDYKSSGLSQAEYSRRTGILSNRLSYWLSKEQGKQTFVKVEKELVASVIELEFSSGVKARVPVGTDSAVIKNLVTALT